MSSSMRRTVSLLHNRLAQAVGPLRGQIVRRKDVHAAWVYMFPDHAADKQWILLSDHSNNRTNHGACQCAESELSLFEYVRRGEYRVL